jgi:hypothetical protein
MKNRFVAGPAAGRWGRESRNRPADGGGERRAAAEPRRPNWTIRTAEDNGVLDVGGITTWDLMLEVWPVDQRPDLMKKPEKVNALTFDQMVTYKKLYDARMKKEGKGEEVFGHDAPIPVTMFESAADDCASQLHAVR